MSGFAGLVAATQVADQGNSLGSVEGTPMLEERNFWILFHSRHAPRLAAFVFFFFFLFSLSLFLSFSLSLFLSFSLSLFLFSLACFVACFLLVILSFLLARVLAFFCLASLPVWVWSFCSLLFDLQVLRSVFFQTLFLSTFRYVSGLADQGFGGRLQHL